MPRRVRVTGTDGEWVAELGATASRCRRRRRLRRRRRRRRTVSSSTARSARAGVAAAGAATSSGSSIDGHVFEFQVTQDTRRRASRLARSGRTLAADVGHGRPGRRATRRDGAGRRHADRARGHEDGARRSAPLAPAPSAPYTVAKAIWFSRGQCWWSCRGQSCFPQFGVRRGRRSFGQRPMNLGPARRTLWKTMTPSSTKSARATACRTSARTSRPRTRSRSSIG